MENTPLYVEKQGFRQILLWIILFLVNILFIYGFITQVLMGKPFGDKPMGDAGLMIATGIVLALTVVAIRIRLQTEIRHEGIHVRFFPLFWGTRTYRWNRITNAYVREYNPLAEFGGWGLRIGPAGQAYTASGNKGIQLVFIDGSKLLIGTNKPAEAEKILRELGRGEA